MTAFLRAKILYGFDLLDTDGDGALTEADHVAMGRRIAAALGHPDGGSAERAIVDAYLGIWRDVHLPQDADGDGRIEKAQFLASTLALSEDAELAGAALGGLAETYFAIADRDADGSIDAAEFADFTRGHCPTLSDASLAEAFGRLDTDDDGRLSLDELRSALVAYWAGNDPDAPGNWIFGNPRHLG
ncbi:EF-hand domain-containing protein [Uniformispora flossi]|uniref:EF-hand domain-containing protein n=1 Tax=Uniformispora flossi TaxID=3390723 RepID=UPI003C2E84C4